MGEILWDDKVTPPAIAGQADHASLDNRPVAGSPRVDVAALRALLSSATPGAWSTKSPGDIHVVFAPDRCVAIVDGGKDTEAADAALIAAMHTELPALLDEISRLRLIVDRFLSLYGPASDVPVDPDLLLRWFSTARPDPVIGVLEQYHHALADIVALAAEVEEPPGKWCDGLVKAVSLARTALGDVARKEG